MTNIKANYRSSATFRKNANGKSLFTFTQTVIEQLRLMGKERTSETYLSALRSFMQFRKNNDILLGDIDSDTMLMYEAYLHNRGISRNSSSFYMRILRALYNRAVERGETPDRTPFRHVYTGVDKTFKRAIPMKAVRKIKELELSRQPSLEFARDMFLFSFYTRGMSFVDMAYLKTKDLTGDILSYRRRKTGQQLFIKWEKCMKEIADRYNNPKSEYILPIIKAPNGKERIQYINALLQTNRRLKQIARMTGIEQPLSTYTARHSWASAAKAKNIPVSVISESMGHDSELTTQIYLASRDTAIIDRANSLILKEL